MAVKSLAVKYRPTTFDDVVGQEAIKTILQQQLDTGTIKNVYLFCGGAGTGKTTCARIFANELNNHQGNPIETDAASNNSVDDMRNIIQQAKTKSLESEYKVFIIDECHALSNSAWQSLLKLLEEPPATSIFIFCTTDPQKIPKTILSRAQRYDFQRISQSLIHNRLIHILTREGYSVDNVDCDGVEYISKLADGGMRDAITLLDKCLSYSPDLTLSNVTKALGTADYEQMIDLTHYLIIRDEMRVIEVIDSIYYNGVDLKQFIKQYQNFLLDVCKYGILGDFDSLQLPETADTKDFLKKWTDTCFDTCLHLLDTVVKLNSEIKWDSTPKAAIQAAMLLDCVRREEQC